MENKASNGGPSSLQKLMISGVRSFDPNHDESIEFYSPLTMIVGANGCGKTTIIECLKFACTGVMPPGANKGQSFVNDPGMTDTTEVKACISSMWDALPRKWTWKAGGQDQKWQVTQEDAEPPAACIRGGDCAIVRRLRPATTIRPKEF